MTPYRDRIPQASDTPSLGYDYAAALERKRSSVAFNALRGIVALALVVGVYPFVALFGSVGWLIGLASFAFIAVPLAIRASQQSAAAEIEAYEARLSNRRKRSRKKRR